MIFKTLFLQLLPTLVAAAGDFQNLSFEDGLPLNLHTVISEGVSVPARDPKDLIPHWSITIDGANAVNVYYANFLVEGGVTLRENTPLAQQFDGLYSLGVWGAREGINGNRVSFPISISQTGTIPINAQRLTIHAYVTDYEVKIDGQLVQSDSTHTSFDVSPFAGREVALEITFKSGYAGDFEIHGFTSVPEPSEMAMLGTGLIVLGWQVWRRR